MLIFLINAAIFVLIGLQLPVVLAEAERPIGQLLLVAAAVAVTAVVVRLIWVTVTSWIAGDLIAPRKTATMKSSLVVGWAGMRGAVSLALALGLPAEPAGPRRHPVRDVRGHPRHPRRAGPDAALRHPPPRRPAALRGRARGVGGPHRGDGGRARATGRARRPSSRTTSRSSTSSGIGITTAASTWRPAARRRTESCSSISRFARRCSRRSEARWWRCAINGVIADDVLPPPAARDRPRGAPGRRLRSLLSRPPARSRSRATSSRRRILPEGTSGSRRSPRPAGSACTARRAPRRRRAARRRRPRAASTTNAFGTSPASSSGIGMTAASVTAG